MGVKAIVLAAGKGKRLLSEQFDLPKVLREANGRPLLGYVLESLSFLEKEDIVIVAGYKREAVYDAFPGYRFAVQQEQLGTGHAAAMAREQLAGYEGPVLVCYGDMPLFKKETYQRLVQTYENSGCACTILTGRTERPVAYGRIVRDAAGQFERVVEDKDCTPEQKQIRELNVGIYVFDAEKLFAALALLKNDNAQGEYYLTDVPRLLMEQGCKVNTFTTENGTEILGVNTPEDLAVCEQALREGY